MCNINSTHNESIHSAGAEEQSRQEASSWTVMFDSGTANGRSQSSRFHGDPRAWSCVDVHGLETGPVEKKRTREQRIGETKGKCEGDYLMRMCRRSDVQTEKKPGVITKQILSGSMWQKKCPWAVQQPGQLLVKWKRLSKVQG